MKKIAIIIVIISQMWSSCSNNSGRNSEAVDIINETPEALNGDVSIKSIASDTKRYGADIVDKLFNEATEKNHELKVLMDEFNIINKSRIDSLEEFNKYTNNNDAYMRSVEYQIAYITDTVLRDELKSVFYEFKTKHDKRIQEHSNAIDSITAKSNIIQDYRIIIKLLVTKSMMENYQVNELPNMEPINGVIQDYDSLILKSQPFVTIK